MRSQLRFHFPMKVVFSVAFSIVSKIDAFLVAFLFVHSENRILGKRPHYTDRHIIQNIDHSNVINWKKKLICSNER